MRLALIFFVIHFFMRGVSLDVTQPQCTHLMPALVVAAQTYDMINTHNQMVRYPAARETDWWSRMFAGPSGRNLIGITLGIALLDEIKWRLTAHSSALRCAAEVDQLQTTLNAIRITHPL